jgi:tetratricopeptide (TPR) repeat protein
MALQGSLKQLRLGDVIQTIVGNGQSGLLRVRQGGQRAVLRVSPEAIRLIEPKVLDEETILDAFVRRGLLTQETVAQARVDLRPAESALSRLRSRREVPEAALRHILESACEDKLLELLSWGEGDFRFDEGAEALGVLPPVSEVSLDPNGLLLRSAQRLDERHAVEACLGRNVVLVVLGNAAAEPPPTEGDDDPVPSVFAQVDGRTLLDEAALRGGFSLFAARSAACALLRAGCVRVATPAELAEQAAHREQAGELHAALALYRQWQAASMSDPAPLAAIAGIAARVGRYEDEAETLKALGRVHLERGEPPQAREVFTRLLAKRPGDHDALEGLRDAARAMGDNDALTATTHALAEQAMESGETAQASLILHDLLSFFPENVPARVLRAKALVRLADRAQAIEELERVADSLPVACRLRADMDAARQCRDLLSQVAPERSDLLRRFRTMIESRSDPKKRIALVGALLLLVAAGGVALWPPSARSLLARAKNAYDLGDTATALNYVSELAERFPDGPELTEAMGIRNRIVAEATKGARPEPAADVYAKVTAQVAKAMAEFPRWPEPDAVEPTRELVALLESPDGDLLRKRVTTAFKEAFVETATRTRRAALERSDALDAAAAAAIRPPSSLARLRELAGSARRSLDLAWAAQAMDAAKAARRLSNALSESSVSEPLRGFESDVEGLVRGIEVGRHATLAVERELLRVEVGDAYDRAVKAQALLATGRLDEAEAIYTRLSELVARAEADPGSASLLEEIERRGVRDFAIARRRSMAGMRRGLEAASAAEKAGDLSGAASIYAKLVADYPFVRFDEVFTIPVRVQSLPAGAEVALNGKPLGKAPLVARYGWGSRTVVTVSATGFDTASVVLRTADPKPEGLLKVSLVPIARWTQALVGVVEAPPLALGEDVLLCNRAGRVELRSGATGEVKWVQDLKTLEGIRAKPAAFPGSLWIPLVDGRAARLAPQSGAVLSMVELPARTVGHAAALTDWAAIATDHSVVVLSASGIAGEAKVEGLVTSGLVAAHGAFWAGTATGAAVRVDPATRATRVLSLGGEGTVIGLAPAREGVLLLTADGRLALVDPSATRTVWQVGSLAEAVGAPAQVGDVVAAADRSGRIRLYSAADGSPEGEVDAGSPAPRGLLEADGRFACVVDDGRLFVYDPAKKAVTIDAPVRAAGSRPPLLHLGGGVIVLPVGENSLSVIPLPR